MKRTPLTRLNLFVGYYMPAFTTMTFAAFTLINTLYVVFVPEFQEAVAPVGTVYATVALMVIIPILAAALAISQTIDYLYRLNGYDPITNNLYIYYNDALFLIPSIIYTVILFSSTRDRFAFRAHIGNGIATAYVTIDLYTLISLSCIVLVLVRQIIFSVKSHPKSADANTEP